MPSNPIQTLHCAYCHYTAQVISERYFESSCQQEVDTMKCNRCNRLSIAPITKKATWPEVTKEEFKIIYDADRKTYFHDFEMEYFYYSPPRYCEELKKVKCLWCNSTQIEKWEIEKPACPKCGGKMKNSKATNYKIDTIEGFKSFIDMTKSSKQVIACFMSDWCFSCSILIPVINEINKEYPNEFKFVMFEMDYAEKHDLIHKFKIKLNDYPQLTHNFNDFSYLYSIKSSIT